MLLLLLVDRSKDEALEQQHFGPQFQLVPNKKNGYVQNDVYFSFQSAVLEEHRQEGSGARLVLPLFCCKIN